MVRGKLGKLLIQLEARTTNLMNGGLHGVKIAPSPKNAEDMPWSHFRHQTDILKLVGATWSGLLGTAGAHGAAETHQR